MTEMPSQINFVFAPSDETQGVTDFSVCNCFVCFSFGLHPDVTPNLVGKLLLFTFSPLMRRPLVFRSARQREPQRKNGALLYSVIRSVVRIEQPLEVLNYGYRFFYRQSHSSTVAWSLEKSFLTVATTKACRPLGSFPNFFGVLHVGPIHFVLPI